MTSHFEIDQEVNNCKDCIFSYMEPKLCALLQVSSRLRDECVCEGVPEEGISDRCPCVKVEEKDYGYN